MAAQLNRDKHNLNSSGSGIYSSKEGEEEEEDEDVIIKKGGKSKSKSKKKKQGKDAKKEMTFVGHDTESVKVEDKSI